MAPENLPIGAWEGDRDTLQKARAGGLGDVADLPEVTRFQTHVARVVIKREQNASAEYDHAAAFVLVSAEQFETLSLGRAVERLIHSGGRRLSSRIHFVQAAAISSVVEEVVGGDAAIFERITSLGYAGLPTVIYVPQKPKSSLSFYPKGCGTDDGVRDISNGADDASPELIEAAIDAVHERELVSPDQQTPLSVWEDHERGRPASNAELAIQQMVRIALSVRFAAFSIRSEQPTKIGRTDLEIVDDQSGPPGQAVHHAVLELKVLRSRGSTGIAESQGDVDRNIESGMEQAYSYGRDKHTKTKMLCCFDMRDQDMGSDVTFEPIKAQSLTLGVLLKRWFLYSSSADYRSAC